LRVRQECCKERGSPKPLKRHGIALGPNDLDRDGIRVLGANDHARPSVLLVGVRAEEAVWLGVLPGNEARDLRLIMTGSG
jgi:hypothetical protein